MYFRTFFALQKQRKRKKNCHKTISVLETLHANIESKLHACSREQHLTSYESIFELKKALIYFYTSRK